MRPKSIVNFERTVLASLVVSALGTALTWDQVSTTAADAGMGTGFVLTLQAITVAVMLLLVWFIARKASPVAKWIYVVLTGLGLVAGLIGLPKMSEGSGISVATTLIGILLSIASLWFLFRPDANAWFNDGRGEA